MKRNPAKKVYTFFILFCIRLSIFKFAKVKNFNYISGKGIFKKEVNI